MKKIILGLTGEIACGKGTFCKYLIQNYEGSAYRFSTPLREILHLLHLPETRYNVQEISIALRKSFGEDVLSQALFEEIKKDEHGIIAVDGIRRADDMKFLKDLPGFRLIYIDAEMKIRFERIRKSGENVYDINKTLKEFKEEHERETERQIRRLKEQADYVISNSSTLDRYHTLIDEIIQKEIP